MNAKQKFQKIMNYEKVDSIPVLAIEWYFEQVTMDNWRKQGLPPDIDVEDCLGMDRMALIPINLFPIPEFEPVVLSEDDEYTVEIEAMGATVKRYKEYPEMYYGHVDHPVKSKADWDEYKKRFDQGTSGRYSPDFAGDLEKLDSGDNPVCLEIYPYFFRLGFYAMGMERFMLAFYETPDLIHEMFSFWSDFVLKVIEPVLGNIKIDCATFLEDFAYKNGPHVSPAFYKEFWLPYQNPIVEALKKSGVNIINSCSSGDLRPLLPLLMDNGFNCIWAVDRFSNMDPITLRKEYGKDLRMAGGIAKDTLFKGPAEIDREIDRLMPLIEEGGYIPSLDDTVPPETPLAHYEYFINKLKSIRL